MITVLKREPCYLNVAPGDVLRVSVEYLGRSLASTSYPIARARTIKELLVLEITGPEAEALGVKSILAGGFSE